MAESARLIISVDSRQVRSADRALGALGRTSSAVASAISAVTASFGVRELYQASEAYQTITNRLKLVTQGNEGLATAQAAVFDIAQKSGQSMTATAELYQRIAQNQDALKLSGEGVAGIVDTISKAMVISGASASSAQAALIQLGQAFASGTLRGEELNSVMEQAPALSQAIAKGMGKAVGELRALGAEGKLTADAVVQSLQTQAGAVDDLFGKMQDTMGTGLTRISNSFTNLVGKMNEVSGVSASIAGSFTSASSAIDSLTEDADSLATTVTTVGAVMSGVAAGGAVLLANKIMVSVVASRAARAANIAQAESALQNAIANQRAAQTAVVRATAEAQAARGTAVQTHMSIQLAQARMREAAATTSVTAAQAGLRTASAGMLAVLGGPVGLALLVGAAASALYVFRDSTKDARPPVDALAGSVDALSDASIRLARISAKEQLAQLAEEARTLERNVTSARDLMNRGLVQPDSRYLDRLEKEEAQLQKNKEEVSELQKRIEDLDNEQDRREKSGPPKPPRSSGDSGEDAKKLASAYDSANESLSRQVALYGQTGEAARVRYEIESGALKGIAGPQADHLIGLAKELDAYEKQAEAIRLMNEQQEQTNLEASSILDSLMTEEEAIKASYERRRKIIMDATLLTAEERDEAMIRLEQERDEKLLEVNGSYWERYLAAAEESLGNFDELAGTVVEGFSSRFGDAFESMVFDAQSLGDAVSGLAEGMARSVVNALGEMAAQWLAYQAVQMIGIDTITAAKVAGAAQGAAAETAAISATTAASTAATATTVATQSAAAATVAAAWTPAAIWASIGSFGQAAVLAGGAILAVKALGGFREGGYTGDGGVNEVAGVVHGKEFVFDAAATSRIGVANLEAIRSHGGLAGMAHDGIDNIPKEGTWLLDRGERVVDRRTNSDLKDYLADRKGGGGAPQITIQAQVTVEGQAGMSEAEARKQGQVTADAINAVVMTRIERESRPGGLLWNLYGAGR